MPYIVSQDRAPLEIALSPVLEKNLSAGELAFVLTRIVITYICKSGAKLSYAALAMAVGIMVLTTFEVIRRVVVPYEDTKRKENGEVFP